MPITKFAPNTRLRLFAACLILALRQDSASAQNTASDTDDFLSNLAALKLFSGVVDVKLKGETVYTKGYGTAYAELDVPVPNDAVFMLGSNTKLITAVAVYQLSEQGLLDVDAPVSDYLDIRELNLTDTWCPRAQGTTSGPCQTPSLAQILSMGSGIQAIDNCPYSPTDFQWPNCLKNRAGGYGLQLDPLRLAVGEYSVADVIIASNILNLPLSFAPGTQFEYSNPGFWLPTYIIEKVSNLTYKEYLQQNIFDPANLTRFTYDLSAETDTLIPGILPRPGYFTVFEPIVEPELAPLGLPDLSNSTLSALGSNGSVRVQSTESGGGAVNMSADANYGQFSTLARPAFFLGLLSLANGAGSVAGDADGLARWYLTLVSEPEKIGLSQATVVRMLNSTNAHHSVPTPFGNLTYAQGTVVVPGERGFLPKYVYYQGDLASFAARILMRVNATDPAKSDTVTQLSNFFPIIPGPQEPSACPAPLDLNSISGVNELIADADAAAPQLPEELLCGASVLAEGIFYGYVEAILRKAWLGIN